MRVFLAILLFLVSHSCVALSDVIGRNAHLDSLLSQLPGMKEDTNKAKVLIEIGQEYKTINLDSAISFTERAKELSQFLEYHWGVSFCLNNLGSFYSDSGLYERSIELTKQALAIDEKLGNHDDMVTCLMNIVEDYVLMQNYEEAMIYVERALKVERARGNFSGMAPMLFRNAQIYQMMSDFSRSLEMYEKTLALYEKLDDQVGVSSTLGHIGVIHEYNGAYDLAIKQHLNALSISEKELEKADESGDKDALDRVRFVIVDNLFGLGAVYSYLGEYDQALEYMQWSYRINNKYKNKKGIAGSLNNIGLVLQAQGKYIEALEYYMKSLAINLELKDKREIAGLYNNIGVVYYEQGDNMDMVKEYLEKALLMKKEIGHTMGVILGLNNLGELYMELGEYDEAIAYSRQSLDMATDIQSLDDIMYANEILAGISEKTGNYKDAYAYYRQYSIAKDSLFNEDKSKEIGKLEAKFEMDKKLEQERRQAEVSEAVKKAAKTRSDNLQYSGILIFLVLVFAGIFLLGRLSLPIRLAEGMIFFAFLLFFEFTLVLLDPYIERYSGGEPAYQLLFNAVLAGLIFPLHSLFERKLVRRLVKKQ